MTFNLNIVPSHVGYSKKKEVKGRYPIETLSSDRSIDTSTETALESVPAESSVAPFKQIR